MPNLADVNGMERDDFTRLFGPVFEHSPWIAERAWERRPFASAADLHAALCETVRSATRDEQLALIRAHPDLLGDAVLTSESVHEQKSAGLASLNEAEVRLFREYNERYRERFGFPFVMCARLNRKEAILRAFPERLEHARQTEIETALAEI